jgi:hypothetical protein
MTQEQINQWARETGVSTNTRTIWPPTLARSFSFTLTQLQRFANLARADLEAEVERIAKDRNEWKDAAMLAKSYYEQLCALKAEVESLRAAPQSVPAGWKLVPVEPTEGMWAHLARDIVFWLYATPEPHYGSKLHDFLRNCGTEIPDWLSKEIPDTGSTPPKGTVAVCIYKAMIAAAPAAEGGV